MITLLLAHNADRKARDRDGTTPLGLARDGHDEETARLLERWRHSKSTSAREMPIIEPNVRTSD